MKRISLFLSTVIVVLLTSCSGTDYVNAIPDGCPALMSIDAAQTAKESNLGTKANVMMSLLKVSDPGDCGIDFSRKVYLFEMPDGNFGMVARVSSQKDLNNWLGRLNEKQLAKPVTERRGFHFSVLKDSWVIGSSKQAVMVMGPVVAAQQAETMTKMAKYLAQGEDDGVKGTPIFEKLDSLEGGMVMVARVRALPDKLAPLLMIGAPKDADDSQVVIAARMSVADGCLHVEGEPFSFNKTIRAAMKENMQTMRPVSDRFLHGFSGQMGLWMNAEGGKLLSLLQQNKSLQAVLAGINTAIDMDNIIRSIDGNLLLSIDNFSDEALNLGMVADLKNTAFLSDVDYWKQSCPPGSYITNWDRPRNNTSYVYVSGHSRYFFGVYGGQKPMFFSGSSEEQAMSLAVLPSLSSKALPGIAGKRFAMMVDFRAIDHEAVNVVTSLLQPLFGQLNAIVYTVE